MDKESSLPKGQKSAEYARGRVEQDFVAAFEAIGTPLFFDFMRTHFCENGVLICNCPPALLQLGGTHTGLVNIIHALRSFFVEFGVQSTAVGDVVVDGAHIVVNYDMALRHVGTGRHGKVSGLNHYVLNVDRKIVKCSIFLDNASLGVIGDVLEAFAETARGMEEARNRRGPRRHER